MVMWIGKGPIGWKTSLGIPTEWARSAVHSYTQSETEEGSEGLAEEVDGLEEFGEGVRAGGGEGAGALAARGEAYLGGRKGEQKEADGASIEGGPDGGGVARGGDDRAPDVALGKEADEVGHGEHVAMGQEGEEEDVGLIGF